jgi:type IV secretion system protein VirB11
VSRERPLLAATLPNGHRVQFVAPSATRAHWALAIRRHRLIDMPLDAYDRGSLNRETFEALPDPTKEPINFLKAAVRRRQTILISGGTSTGKTTFLNALLREVPADERVIVVEDTPEVRLHGVNDLGLIAVKGDCGEALINVDDLLQTALRLRPDRILLGELRGKEAVSFLRAVNTGHPGSFSTIHANSPAGALEQLALMVMQSGLGLSRTDTITYARSVIDVIVQLGRQGADRGIVAIEQMSPASSVLYDASLRAALGRMRAA